MIRSFKIDFGKQHSCSDIMCREWRITTNGNNLMFPEMPDGYYCCSEVDNEFVAWLYLIPEIMNKKKGEVPFTDDAHSFHFEPIDDTLKLTMEFKWPEYHNENGKRKTVWKSTKHSDTVKRDDFMTEMTIVGRAILKEMEAHSLQPDRIKNFRDVLQTAESAISKKKS